MANTTDARQKIEETASTAIEQGKEAGHVAREATGSVVGDALDQVSNVRDEVKGQARQLVDDTKSQLRDKADGQTSQLADALGTFGGELQALVSGQPDRAGTAGHYVEQAGNAVDDLARQIRERNFEGLVNDVQRFARRRPGVFLAAVAATGFVAGRLARSAKDDRDNDGELPGGAGEVTVGSDADTPPDRAASSDEPTTLSAPTP